jgi:hypothetical protein
VRQGFALLPKSHAGHNQGARVKVLGRGSHRPGLQSQSPLNGKAGLRLTVAQKRVVGGILAVARREHSKISVEDDLWLGEWEHWKDAGSDGASAGSGSTLSAHQSGNTVPSPACSLLQTSCISGASVGCRAPKLQNDTAAHRCTESSNPFGGRWTVGRCAAGSVRVSVNSIDLLLVTDRYCGVSMHRA